MGLFFNYVQATSRVDKARLRTLERQIKTASIPRKRDKMTISRQDKTLTTLATRSVFVVARQVEHLQLAIECPIFSTTLTSNVTPLLLNIGLVQL